jgi:hypothetical protein
VVIDPKKNVLDGFAHPGRAEGAEEHPVLGNETQPRPALLVQLWVPGTHKCQVAAGGAGDTASHRHLEYADAARLDLLRKALGGRGGRAGMEGKDTAGVQTGQQAVRSEAGGVEVLAANHD